MAPVTIAELLTLRDRILRADLPAAGSVLRTHAKADTLCRREHCLVPRSRYFYRRIGFEFMGGVYSRPGMSAESQVRMVRYLTGWSDDRRRAGSYRARYFPAATPGQYDIRVHRRAVLRKSDSGLTTVTGKMGRPAGHVSN
ncbi:hypothetical protein [Paraburkholderia phosphatilytica]|uniref:hypothetical protein n=1 Tax=Paraburkholderia phosphatilytica TaxID=2282883 RepID=UPI000F5EA135|nr:hypothetical protein [Paraburkholderia phosphatilytica]